MKWVSGIRLRSAAAGLVLMIGGCSTPPSVPLLVGVAQRVINDERTHLDDDVTRQLHWYDQQRAALEDAFNTDVKEQATLDAAWVTQGAAAYAAAREALMQQQMKQQQAIATRQENLQLADDALGRASDLMQQADQLFWQAPQLRQWINEHVLGMSPSTSTSAPTP